MPGEAPVPDLAVPRRIHVVAVGGAGMSAIATILAEAGHTVSGTDASDSERLAPLRARGVTVEVGHRAAAVAGADLVVVSSAVPADNVELLAARRAGTPVMNRRQFLPLLARQQPLLSVAGTHGKTTTTAMLAVLLRAAGEDPSWLVGAEVAALGAAAHHGGGRNLVIEADESDGSFLAGPRQGALVTNLEADHLEFWGDEESLAAGFREFVGATAGPVSVCGDDPGSAALRVVPAASGVPVTYGMGGSCDYRVTELETSVQGSRFTLRGPGGDHRVLLGLPGAHNALNAAGAISLAAEMGVELGEGIGALADLAGIQRRFERRGSAAGVEVVDDYAHLPTEVRAALAAGADTRPGRLVVVFQPHRYSRTEALWSEFADCFDAADVLVLTDVYPAGEQPRPGVTGQLLVRAVEERGSVAPVWAATLPEAADALLGVLQEGDLLMTVGAGDVREVGDLVLAKLGERG